jgi:phosphoribosylformylglycinamidine (FGAM) synthase-like amidotransferase family enzyme
MPHPDRAFERFHPSLDGLKVASAVLSLRFPEILRRSA